MLFFSGCESVTNSRFIHHQEALPDFAALVEAYRDPATFIDAEKKDDLPLWMLAEFSNVGVRRCAANVLKIHGLILDIDKGEPDDFNELFQSLNGIGHIVYTTFSHDPAKQWKFRIIVKISRPIDITEWSAFWIRATNYLNAHEVIDRKCSDPAHLYYVPGGDRQKYECNAEDGPGLNVDMVLKLPLAPNELEPHVPNYTPILESEDRGEVTQALIDYWDAKLYNLCHEIRIRDIPGSIYDLKSHGVFGLARGIASGIISEDRIRNMTRNALTYRYQKHDDPAEAAVWCRNSFNQVDQAIEDGKEVPWYPPKINDIETHPLTEYGLRERLLDQHEEDLVYEPSWGAWLVWNGKYWNMEAGRALVQERQIATTRTIALEAQAYYLESWIARQEYERVVDDPDVSEEVKEAATHRHKALEKRINDIFSFALKSETRNRTNAAIELASSDRRVLLAHRELNKDPYLLNFSNGVLDLHSGKLHDHRREDYITRMVPHDFDPHARCPTFDKFLLECMDGRQGLVNYIWRLLGYTAIGVTTEQILILNVGDGANGKTTFSNIILEAFGQGEGGYGFAANSENLLTPRGASRHETYRMSLFGKRYVPCQEVEEGRSFAESLIKELCGSDPITGRKMRQDEWTYIPVHQIWLSVNHLPMVRGTDEGIWRRLKVIPWDVSFKGREDTKLPDKLRLEIPGIWARIAREAVLWQQEGLPVPPEVKVATDEYRREQDPLEPFFELWCVVGADPEDFAPRDLLWAAYLTYCDQANRRDFHQKKTFFTALKKRFRDTQQHGGKRGFKGIRLMTPKERVDALPQSKLNEAQKDPKKDFSKN